MLCKNFSFLRCQMSSLSDRALVNVQRPQLYNKMGIIRHMERKSEVEQGIEEQRLDMEKEKLKICKRKAGFRSRAEKTGAGFSAEGKRSKRQG